MDHCTLENMVTSRLKIVKSDSTYFLRDLKEPLNTVGYITLRGDKYRATINLLISPEYRKQGYGKEAMSMTLVWLFMMDNLRHLDFVISTDNFSAASFAIKFGFVPTDVLTPCTNFRLYSLSSYRWLVYRNGD